MRCGLRKKHKRLWGFRLVLPGPKLLLHFALGVFDSSLIGSGFHWTVDRDHHQFFKQVIYHRAIEITAVVALYKQRGAIVA